MSRIGKEPIVLPKGVEVTLDQGQVSVKGTKGTLTLKIHESVKVQQNGGVLQVGAADESKQADAISGTTRTLVNNMVIGVSQGFTKELQLQGVGYRAQINGRELNLALGFSHPVIYPLPEGIEIQTPSQTQVIVRGIDKQQVGQVSAEIRAIRPPEPYKGKGVRYATEIVRRKEAKKK